MQNEFKTGRLSKNGKGCGDKARESCLQENSIENSAKLREELIAPEVVIEKAPGIPIEDAPCRVKCLNGGEAIDRIATALTDAGIGSVDVTRKRPPVRGSLDCLIQGM